MKRIISWYKRILQLITKDPAILHASGTIYKLDSYREATGYRRFFIIQWYETYGKDIQHHELPVNAWNKEARLVKGDGYKDGDEVSIIGKVKTHTGEIYLELLDIIKDSDVRS